MDNDSKGKLSFMFSIHGATGSMAFQFSQINLWSSWTISESYYFQEIEQLIWLKMIEVSVCVCVRVWAEPLHLIQIKVKKNYNLRNSGSGKFSILLIYYLFISPSCSKKRFKAVLSIFIIYSLLSYVCEHVVAWGINAK